MSRHSRRRADTSGLVQHALTLPREHKHLRRFSAALLGAVLAVGTFAGLAYADLQSSLKNANGVSKLLKDRKPIDSFNGRAINILLIGSDSREGDNQRYGTDEGTQRSDTTLIAHISADRKKIDVVSIPRDTMVEIPGCSREDGTETYPGFGIFNSAFANGGLDGSTNSAVACTLKTVEHISGMYIDAFVVTDFTGFSEMIDALGGVKLYLDEPMQDIDSQLDLPAGCNTLDGHDALAYARVRHVGDGSDISRIARQQQLLSIMLRTALKKNMFTEMPVLYDFVNAGLKSLVLSPELAGLPQLSGLAYSLRNIDPENIRFFTPPITNYAPDPNRVVFIEEPTEQIWEYFQGETDTLPDGVSVRTGAGRTYTTGTPGDPDYDATADSTDVANTDNPADMTGQGDMSGQDGIYNQGTTGGQVSVDPNTIPGTAGDAAARAKCEV